ncbi:hypothetical protein D5b_00428 [Faustovirus]|nr:hypothetical protein D5b_00428 [Faustovirus]AMN84488.1 hypothetical protein D6_00077 [Faustovirus]AMP44370.1 hypothetical protein PRJ_Dakar_00419 [Faustovirus]QKE50184.1 hypothetical protein F-VV10_0064 [Faustovirus]
MEYLGEFTVNARKCSIVGCDNITDKERCAECEHVLCNEFGCKTYPFVKTLNKVIEGGRVNNYRLDIVNYDLWEDYHGDWTHEYHVKLTKK